MIRLIAKLTKAIKTLVFMYCKTKQPGSIRFQKNPETKKTPKNFGLTEFSCYRDATLCLQFTVGKTARHLKTCPKLFSVTFS